MIKRIIEFTLIIILLILFPLFTFTGGSYILHNLFPILPIWAGSLITAGFFIGSIFIIILIASNDIIS